ncbi:MAG: methyltransferase domain-containing protein [Microcoleaceae cyanobacterium]
MELAKNLGLPSPQVTIVNLYSSQVNVPENITWVVGNGKKLPFENMAFDLAFRNSVIEHLYDWESQLEFAN